MPGYKCSIKERMLYSSCKSPLVDVAEQDMKMEIVKKVSFLGLTAHLNNNQIMCLVRSELIK